MCLLLLKQDSILSLHHNCPVTFNLSQLFLLFFSHCGVCMYVGYTVSVLYLRLATWQWILFLLIWVVTGLEEEVPSAEHRRNCSLYKGPQQYISDLFGYRNAVCLHWGKGFKRVYHGTQTLYIWHSHRMDESLLFAGFHSFSHFFIVR